jgi:hypothetical protein
MKIQQILVKPREKNVIVIYADTVGYRGQLMLDAASLPEAGQLISVCEQRLPSDAENPNKDEIEREISALEKRLTALREAVGTS